MGRASETVSDTCPTSRSSKGGIGAGLWVSVSLLGEPDSPPLIRRQAVESRPSASFATCCRIRTKRASFS